MDTNPYKTPDSNESFNSKIKVYPIRALLAGSTGFGVVIVFGGWVSVIFQHWLDNQGVPLGELYYALGDSLLLNIIGHILGFVGGMLGGALAGKFCGVKYMAHGALSAVPMLMYATAAQLNVFPPPWPLWSQVLGLILPIPAGILGAWLYKNNKT